MPISVLGLLAVGRVLAEPEPREADARLWRPEPPTAFLGSEWIVELCFGSPQTSIVSAAALGLKVWPLPAQARRLAAMRDERSAAQASWCSSPAGRSFGSTTRRCRRWRGWCWSFRVGREGTLERLMGYFDGHRFQKLGHPTERAQLGRGDPAASDRSRRGGFVRPAGRHPNAGLPPFAGPTTLEVVGHPTMVGEREALFVQQILESRALPAGQPGIRGGPSRWSPPSARTSSTWRGG